MEWIGYMYNLGCGVKEDKTKALKWYRRAAEIGDMNLENHFAYCLEDGDGVEQNLDEAIYWFRRSAELGNKDAIYRWRLKDPERALEIYKLLVEQGEDCYYTLGKMYLRGEGTEKNIHEAIKWFEKVAQIEVINDSSDDYCKWDSMLKIAEIYVGLKDETKALEWLTKRNDSNRLQGIGELAHIYYGDDRELAADEIYNFERACDKTLVNLYTRLEIMSIVADLLEDNCPQEFLEKLTESYEKVYQEIRDNGMSEEIEGDEDELGLKKMFNKKEKVVKGTITTQNIIKRNSFTLKVSWSVDCRNERNSPVLSSLVLD